MIEDKNTVVRDSICNFMDMNKSYFIGLVDGPFESHLSKQGELNGSVVSWATEVESQAASILYGVNVNIRMRNDQEYHQHIFSLLQQEDCLTYIPYGRTIFWSLKDDHF